MPFAMTFHYTHHIRKRIRERGITEWQIEQTVTQPDAPAVCSFRDRYWAEHRFYDRILRVVYAQENERIILITAYWLKEGK